MHYWLIKSEPNAYSWADLVRDGKTYWDGVRNAQARNNLKKMRRGDLCLFYHSNIGKEIVGVARVVKQAYQDPTTSDNRWVVVDLVPQKEFTLAVPLSTLRSHPGTEEMAMMRQSRLSVSPVRAAEFSSILRLAQSSR